MKKMFPPGIPVAFETLDVAALKRVFVDDSNQQRVPKCLIFPKVSGVVVGYRGILDVDSNAKCIVVDQKHLVWADGIVWEIPQEQIVVNEELLNADWPNYHIDYALGSVVYVVDNGAFKKGTVVGIVIAVSSDMVLAGEPVPVSDGLGTVIYDIVFDDNCDRALVPQTSLIPYETKYTRENYDQLMVELSKAHFAKKSVTIVYDNPNFGKNDVFVGTVTEYMCPELGKSGNSMFELDCTERNNEPFFDKRKLWHRNVVSLTVSTL